MKERKKYQRIKERKKGERENEGNIKREKQRNIK